MKAEGSRKKEMAEPMHGRDGTRGAREEEEEEEEDEREEKRMKERTRTSKTRRQGRMKEMEKDSNAERETPIRCCRGGYNGKLNVSKPSKKSLNVTQWRPLGVGGEMAALSQSTRSFKL